MAPCAPSARLGRNSAREPFALSAKKERGRHVRRCEGGMAPSAPSVRLGEDGPRVPSARNRRAVRRNGAVCAMSAAGREDGGEWGHQLRRRAVRRNGARALSTLSADRGEGRGNGARAPWVDCLFELSSWFLTAGSSGGDH